MFWGIQRYPTKEMSREISFKLTELAMVVVSVEQNILQILKILGIESNDFSIY